MQEFFSRGGRECHCQGPPLPFPLPVPIPLQIGSSPVPLKVDLIHCLPLPLEVGPIIQLGGLGERCKLPPRARSRAPTEKAFPGFSCSKKHNLWFTRLDNHVYTPRRRESHTNSRGSGVGTMETGGTLYPKFRIVLPVPPSQRCGLCQDFKQTTLTTRLYKVRTNLYPPTYENVPTRLSRGGWNIFQVVEFTTAGGWMRPW